MISLGGIRRSGPSGGIRSLKQIFKELKKEEKKRQQLMDED